MSNKIEVQFIRDETTGRIDVNATLGAWSNDLAVYASKEEADLDVIADAVNRVWEENPGLKFMTLDAVSTFALSHIPGVSPGALEDVKERIQDYVRGATERFHIGKGKGGGVQFLERLSPDELVKVNAQRTKAAAKAALKAA